MRNGFPIGAIAASIALATYASRPDGHPYEPRETPPEPSSSPPRAFRITKGNRDIAVRIGVRLDGVDRPNDVIAYDVDEGWIQTKDTVARGKGKRMTGVVEAYWRTPAARATMPTIAKQTKDQANEALARAEAKRRRKAEKLERLRS